MTARTRSESALIRPYLGIDVVDTALDPVRLLVNEQEYEAGPVVLGDETLAKAAFTLRLPAPDVVRALVENTPVPAVDCGVVVMATGRSHRGSRVIVQEYLRVATYATEFEIQRPSADLILNDRFGFNLTVAIVLLNDLAPKPLRPHMAGTWLARRVFKVAPETDETSFSPEELTDAIRVQFGLPKGTLRYVHVEPLLDEEDITDGVRVYVDAEVLRLLLANPDDRVAIQMQTELALQATETVAVALSRELSEGNRDATPEGLEAYPGAQRFFGNLARTLGRSVSDVMELATEPSLLRALLEAPLGLRDATSDALREV